MALRGVEVVGLDEPLPPSDAFELHDTTGLARWHACGLPTDPPRDVHLFQPFAALGTFLRAVFKSYPRLRKQYASDDGDDTPPPPVKSPRDLRSVITPSVVNVLAVARSGHAYLGLDFERPWDDEHGLGVLTH